MVLQEILKVDIKPIFIWNVYFDSKINKWIVYMSKFTISKSRTYKQHLFYEKKQLEKRKIETKTPFLYPVTDFESLL
jgi:hypothetical protein